MNEAYALILQGIFFNLPKQSCLSHGAICEGNLFQLLHICCRETVLLLFCHWYKNRESLRTQNLRLLLHFSFFYKEDSSPGCLLFPCFQGFVVFDSFLLRHFSSAPKYSENMKKMSSCFYARMQYRKIVSRLASEQNLSVMKSCCGMQVRWD